MNVLNFQHLRYFWCVAREGSLTRAAQSLGLATSTLSEQVHSLEEDLGCQLLVKSGRELVLTDVGRRIAHYAEQVVQLGKLIEGIARSGESPRTLRLCIGVGASIPKLAVHKITEPLFQIGTHVRLSFCDERSSNLLNGLEVGRLDIAISDGPLGQGSETKPYEQHLLEAEVYLFGSAFLWEKYRKNYPRSLVDAPFYLPTAGTTLRRSLDKWFYEQQISPRIIGEFDDAALMRVFGQSGTTIFPATSFVKQELEIQFNLRSFGKIEGIKETYFVLLSEKAFTNKEVRNAVCNIS